MENITGTKKVKIQKVIVTESVIGDGTKENPVRILYKYWDLKGNLIFEKDDANIDIPKLSKGLPINVTLGMFD